MAGKVLVSGDIVQTRAWTHDTDQAAVNTWYWLVTGFNPDGVDEEDVAVGVDAVAGPLIKPCINNLAVYDGVQSRDISQLPLGIMQQSKVNAGDGTSGAAALPRQTAGLIQWRTTKAGPGGRGRTYMPFPSTTDTELNGKPTVAYQGHVNALATALMGITQFIHAGNPLQLVSVEMVLKVKPGLSSLGIETFAVSDKWATQKRRGAFGRVNVSPLA